MKKLLIACLTLTLFFNCNTNEFTINGTAKGFADGTQLILQSVGEKGNEVIRDSAVVKNEKFTMNGTVEFPEVTFLRLKGSETSLTFMLENSKIDIDLLKENLTVSKITGSTSQNDMDRFQNQFNKIMDENRKIAVEYRKTDFRTEPKKRDSLAKLISNYGDTILAHPLNFIKKNKDSYFGLNLIGLEANKSKFDVKGFVEVYEELDPKLKATPRAKNIKQTLDSLYTIYKKTEHLEPGQVAPNFEAPSVDGSIISLNSIKGKVTLISFWTSYDKRSRNENLNLARIYNKYHDQGLEILSISLDGAQNQNSPKESWIAAIEDDQLIWNNISNLKGSNCEIAKLYNIKSIPSVYILDKSGKIVAKNLRNYGLQSQVEDLLKD